MSKYTSMYNWNFVEETTPTIHNLIAGVISFTQKTLPTAFLNLNRYKLWSSPCWLGFWISISSACSVSVSPLVGFVRDCSWYEDFPTRGQLLTSKLLSRRCVKLRHESSPKQCYVRYYVPIQHMFVSSLASEMPQTCFPIPSLVYLGLPALTSWVHVKGAARWTGNAYTFETLDILGVIIALFLFGIRRLILFKKSFVTRFKTHLDEVT